MLLVLKKLFLHIRNPKRINEFINEKLVRSNGGLLLNPSKGLLEMRTYQLTEAKGTTAISFILLTFSYNSDG